MAPFDHRILAVLGGSSVGTPTLLRALLEGIARRDLPAMSVRLYGRNALRLCRIRDYTETIAQADPGVAALLNQRLSVTVHTDLRAAVDGADVILCQVRPGNMRGRAADEQLAWDAGVPADEGLGPGGLACYLRGREPLTELLDSCSRWAPEAVLLQMTSPLGLTVALSRSVFGTRAYGVCELPATTSAKVLAHVEPVVGAGPLTHAHAGLNHCSWLYAFCDRTGRDATMDVIAAIDTPDLLGVDPETILREGAVPVPYLRLFYHAQRELERQLSSGRTRGAALGEWASALDDAYCAESGPKVAEISDLLGQRYMAWYAEGVLPVLAAILGSDNQGICLNLPNDGAMPGIDDDAIVEVPCHITERGVRPLPTPPLPRGPAELTKTLVAYEKRVAKLPVLPTVAELEDVLVMHPMVPAERARSIATGIVRNLSGTGASGS